MFLPGEFHGQKSLAGYSPQGHKELDMTERLTYPLISQSAAPYLLTLLKTPANRQVGCLSWKQQFLSSFLKLKKPSSNSDRNYELILSNTPHTQPPHTHTPHMYTYPPPNTHTHTHPTHTHTYTLEDPRVRSSPLPPGGSWQSAGQILVSLPGDRGPLGNARNRLPQSCPDSLLSGSD